MHKDICINAGDFYSKNVYSPQTHWRRYSLYFLMIILMLGGSKAWAKFEFFATDGGGIDLHLIPKGVQEIPHEFTARFRACKSSDCATADFANYRLAISSDGIYNANILNVSTLDGIVAFDGSSPEVVSLASSVPATPSHAVITQKGGWTQGDTKDAGFSNGTDVKADYVTATFKVKLNVAELKRIALSNDPYLRFYVNGQETSQTTRNNYYDSKMVETRLNYPAQYKVSGLKDIDITANSTPVTDGYYQSQMDFCVYVSRSPYDYNISVYGEDWSKFALTSGGDSINYDVQIGEKNGESINWSSWSSSPIENAYKTNGHTSETCNSHTDNNAAIRVRIPKEAGSDGIYKDIITVNISAT